MSAPGAHHPTGRAARNRPAADPDVVARDGVRKVLVPRAARQLCTLSHVDFEDAYLVDIDPMQRTAEQWARAIFDGASPSVRVRLWSTWMVLGLRLAPPTSPRHVLGFEVRQTTPGAVLLGTRSRIGMPAQLLVKRHDGGLLFDTFVQQSNPLARAVWAATEPAHERVLPALLRQFRRRVEGEAA